MKTKAPARIEITAVTRVVVPLAEGYRWRDCIEAVPIVSNLDERVRLHPFEKEILLHLAHLQHVCHRPRLHLRVDEERVPVARARRVPARAVASLVAHPGDWEHRTLTGIQPFRVLATQVEDDWNLYENRMAARLVDHLLAWTSTRLDELRRLSAMVEDGHDFQDETRGSRFRATRLFDLWARVFQNEGLTRELMHTLRMVERLQRSLQALLDSPLYTRIPRGAFVAPALVPTNILVNDPHYRKVAALWRSWVRVGHHHEPSREELRRRKDQERRDFETFARVLVIRALHDLGYHGDLETVVSGAGAVNLQGPLGAATLTMKEETLRFEIDGSALTIGPRLASLDDENAAAMWQQITEEPGVPGDTAVLLLGRPEELEQLDPHTARAFGGWERPRLLLVSAWSLDCVERIARLLRGWEGSIRFAGYPRRARVSPDPGVILPPWLERVGDVVAIVKPASAEERETMRRLCATREATLEREQSDAKQGRRRFDPGAITALTALRALAGKVGELEPWSSCPACNTRGNDFEPRPAADGWERWSWWCRCNACSAEWGLRVCASCKRSYPVLDPKVIWPAVEDQTRATALDRAFGRDLWAEPRVERAESRSFRCTRCGA